MSIKGKQIRDSTITQDKMYILTETILDPISVTNKEWVEGFINDSLSVIGNSTSDMSIVANSTTADTGSQLACSRRITDDPVSMVRVLVNGVEMRVGSDLATYDCYFSPDGAGGATVRAPSEEQEGDYLYWNTDFTEFQLDSNDRIDYVYLTVSVNLDGGGADPTSQNDPDVDAGTADDASQTDPTFDGGRA